MNFKETILALICLAAAGLAVLGCDAGNGLPTGASPLQSATGDDRLSEPISPLASEETDCPNLEVFRLRTSDPGSIEDNVVNAWIKLVGAPADATAIRIWWNYDDGASEDYLLEDLDVTMNDDGTINVELLAEHTYKDLTGETERTIRAELLVGNDATHCARVRHITVAPPPPDPPKKPKKKPICSQFNFGPLNVLCLSSN